MAITVLGGEVRLPHQSRKSILVSFLDPRTEAAYSQLVFLRSIARQYTLPVFVILPPASLSPDDLANFAYDWQDEFIHAYVGDDRAAQSFGALKQATFLIENGQIVRRWDGCAPTCSLAAALQNDRWISAAGNEAITPVVD